MEIHYTGNGNLSGILGELVGRESGSLGSLGCVVFHVRMGFNGRCLMRVGLGPAPSFPFFYVIMCVLQLLTLQQDMLVRVNEFTISLVISTLALSCAIPLGDMLMVGWYLCWGPEVA